MKTLLTLLVSAIIGSLIWRMDSQPHWDDSGITAVAILISSGLICFVNPQRPYVCAIAVSIWIPFFGIMNDENYGTLLTFLFGFIGAYAGSIFKRRILN